MRRLYIVHCRIYKWDKAPENSQTVESSTGVAEKWTDQILVTAQRTEQVQEMVLLLPLLLFLILLSSVSPDARPRERIVGGADASLGLPLFQGFLGKLYYGQTLEIYPDI